MKKKQGVDFYVTRFVVITCIVYFVMDIGGFAVKNILYDIFGIKNDFIISVAKLDMETINSNDNTEGDGFEETIVNIDWEELYPFDDDETLTSSLDLSDALIVKNYIKTTKFLISKIDERFEWFLPFRKEIRRAYQMLGSLYFSSISGGDVIYLKNGYMTYVEPPVSKKNVDLISDSIYEFDSYLKEMNIPFLYVNCGSKVCPYDKQLDFAAIEYSNENGDALLNALKEKGVDCFDMRKKMIEDNLDWYDSYYKTDHHWKTETGLWAAGVLAKELNDNYGFSFDKKYFDSSSYNAVTYDDFWLGGQGKQNHFNVSNLESFTLLIPEYETDFSIEIPSKNINLRGSSAQTLINPDLLNVVKQYSNNDYLYKATPYEYCTRIKNNPLNHIRNYRINNNDDKKILLLQDSFCNYSTGFLASDISSIDTIHPAKFTGSIRKYVKETKPDMVVMMLCENQINQECSEKIWKSHKYVFDLR